ncbi:MAG: insulinase family protein [Rikenellaceae bacterium]|nr:insulinase family protein [Rikenellaceae bacterium]
MEEFTTYTLPNGIRGIHRQVKGAAVAHCALIVGAGTRDEAAHEFGLAHLTEHALFKGTEKRKAWQVNCRLENLGGELNAFTTKEDTTVHATVLKGDFGKAVELIADVVFRSTFPDRELEREKEVIIDEINTYKDAPAELIYDTFEDLVFEGSELGHNILGRKASLMRYTGDSVRQFVRRTYTTDQMVFSSIGSFSTKTAEAYARRYLGDFTASSRSDERRATLPLQTPFDRTIMRHTHQTHCILGARAYDLQDEKRLPLSLLINRLGGPCANSILNVEVREKHGLTYNIEANYTPYSDAGVVAIYFSSDHHHTDDCLELIHKELQQLRTTPFTARQLAMAKRQFIAQMAISCENKENYILGAGKAILSHGEMDTMEEAYRKIQALTAFQLQEVAEEVFCNLSKLTFK